VKKNVAGILDKDKELDTLILGCTHYPLLASIIKKYIPSGINILNQGKIVAEKLVDYLKRHPEIEQRLSKSGKVEFQTTESSETFENKAALFLDQKIKAQKIHL
jgi:glutamate racemase